MALLFIAPDRDPQPWKEAMLEVDSNLDIRIWPNVGNKKEINFIVSWNHPPEILHKFPNLQAISSLGAGVDHLLKDERLSEGVTICRVITESLRDQVSEYVLASTLIFQRDFHRYISQKKQKQWDPHPNRAPDHFITGVLGLGEIGLATAEELSSYGYRVRGWSKHPREHKDIATYAGRDQLDRFCVGLQSVVCLLPLTSETEGVLDLDLFRNLQHPAFVINAARGEHLVDEDLIYAIDKGWIEGAFLDVFEEEPLPESHAFWNREEIYITPHIAGITPPEEAASIIVDNYKRAISGMELRFVVDRQEGY